VDESETVRRVCFIVFDESAIGGEPGESAFNDPSFALHDESSASAVQTFNDFQTGTAAWRFFAHHFNQSWSRVGSISPEMTQPTKLP